MPTGTIQTKWITPGDELSMNCQLIISNILIEIIYYKHIGLVHVNNMTDRSLTLAFLDTRGGTFSLLCRYFTEKSNPLSFHRTSDK
jgi:hypothetical protein